MSPDEIRAAQKRALESFSDGEALRLDCMLEAKRLAAFRADRVIGKAPGRRVPLDLFRVDLPSPPLAENEGPTREPRVGVTVADVRKLYGAPNFRVDYVRNGQPPSRESYES